MAHWGLSRRKQTKNTLVFFSSRLIFCFGREVISAMILNYKKWGATRNYMWIGRVVNVR